MFKNVAQSLAHGDRKTWSSTAVLTPRESGAGAGAGAACPWRSSEEVAAAAPGGEDLGMTAVPEQTVGRGSGSRYVPVGWLLPTQGFPFWNGGRGQGAKFARGDSPHCFFCLPALWSVQAGMGVWSGPFSATCGVILSKTLVYL